MLHEQARSIACEALRRGLLKPEDVWDIACRALRTEGDAAFADLLSPSLDPDALAALRVVDETMSATWSTTATASSQTSSRASSAPPRARSSPPAAAYEVREVIGTGGAGVVHAAREQVTGRTVALKTLKEGAREDARTRHSFLEEARITARLEHPSIVPVYDMGTLPDGEPYYTMRIVERRSLRDVLRRDELRADWPLARLLGAIVQVARALAYAHARGFVHRDVKPANILLGSYGEVYVADWGLAKAVGENVASTGAGAAAEGASSTLFAGTPGYMAPEQCGFEDGKVDARTDVFALGVVLYEVLTGALPFDGTTVFRSATDEVRPPRDRKPDCPILLQDVCMKMLSKSKKSRTASAEAVALEIEAFLEGAKEKELRRAEARRLATRARESVGRFESLAEEHRTTRARASEALAAVKGWEPVERKQSAWRLEDRADEAEREAGAALTEAVELYTKALGYDVESPEAHRGLAALYWSRARAAEAERKPPVQARYEALAIDHDPDSYVELLTAEARLTLRSDPAGAETRLFRYVEHDRLLVATAERRLGRTPLDMTVEAGSYLVVLEAPGFPDVRYPVRLDRGSRCERTVTFYTRDEIGPDFVFVPRSSAILGGDPEANDTLPRQEVMVEDYAIARFPVTMREYCAFLDEVERTAPGFVLKRAPHDRRGSEGLSVRKSAHGLWEPDPIMIEGDARELYPHGEGHEWRVPAHLVDWFDARAFCEWRAAREQVRIRLPTEAEWEKAARGVDGRFFPWGDRFDPTFCLMRQSRSYGAQPEPVGTFPTDVSPYGVRDMAGGMREWVGDVHGLLDAASCAVDAEPDPELPRDRSPRRAIRSGSWNADTKWSRCASRGVDHSAVRGTGVTFRCAKTLTRAR